MQINNIQNYNNTNNVQFSAKINIEQPLYFAQKDIKRLKKIAKQIGGENDFINFKTESYVKDKKYTGRHISYEQGEPFEFTTFDYIYETRVFINSNIEGESEDIVFDELNIDRISKYLHGIARNLAKNKKKAPAKKIGPTIEEKINKILNEEV